MSHTLIVACIPAYNEEKTIGRVVLVAQKHVDKVVVCDDGSLDLTADIAQGLGATVIRHDRNLGYGAAMQSLFRKARELDADVMLTLDGDGQHDAREIPKLIEPISVDKADIVVGSRFLTGNNDIPPYRRLGIRFITKMSGRHENGRVSDAQSGFRAYSKKAIQGLRLHENGMGASTEIMLKAREKGFRVAEVPVETRYQGLETSTQNWLMHGSSVMMSIVRVVVEERPLVYLGIPGVVFLIIGMFFGVWMLQMYTVQREIATNIALASIAFALIGTFAIFTAITLYAITRSVEKRTEY